MSYNEFMIRLVLPCIMPVLLLLSTSCSNRYSNAKETDVTLLESKLQVCYAETAFYQKKIEQKTLEIENLVKMNNELEKELNKNDNGITNFWDRLPGRYFNPLAGSLTGNGLLIDRVGEGFLVTVVDIDGSTILKSNYNTPSRTYMPAGSSDMIMFSLMGVIPHADTLTTSAVFTFELILYAESLQGIYYIDGMSEHAKKISFPKVN